MRLYMLEGLMFAGVLYGLSACALWGLTYLLPVLLPEYDALYIAIARAFVMGLVSLLTRQLNS